MKTSVSDLFGTWQGRVQRDMSQEMVTNRLSAIETLVEGQTKVFWLDVVRMAYGISNVNEANRDKFVQFFVNEEASFPVIQNTELVKNLAGISICFLLQKATNEWCLEICLATITSNFLGQYDTSDIPILDFANKYLSDLIDDEVVQEDGTSSQEILTLVNSLKSDEYQVLPKDSRAIAKNIYYLLQTVRRLKEETNIHWWLYSEYSRFANASFREVGLSQMIAVSAIELYDLTDGGQEVRSAKSLLHKAISLSNNGKLKSISIFDVVNSLDQSMKARFLKDCEKVLDFAPCIRAINIAGQFAPGEDWSKFYKHNTGGDVTARFAAEVISLELHRELFLLLHIK